ncbi:hypothetical protein [Zavarzinia sp. CC-PAN008]|uniref:hypothetical protein n=1 Tax=Zavarzinia sp. CC-PAN008 TaxID=3243332 RepID=UPI003F745A15
MSSTRPTRLPDECQAQMRAAAGGHLTDAEMVAMVDALERRRRRLRDEALISDPEALAQAAASLMGEQRMEALLQRRTALVNERARLRRDDFYAQHKGREGWALRTLIAGSEESGPGVARSVDAEMQGIRFRLIGPMLSQLRRDGVLGLLMPDIWGRARHPELEDDVANELWRLTDDTGGRDTGNAQAKQIAQAIHTAQEAARVLQNRAGAWINKLPGYVVRQSHDLLKVRDAGFAAWRAAIEPRLTDDTFATDEGPMTAADRTRFLEAVWRGLSTGQHLKSAGAEDPVLKAYGSGSLARKASQHRVLHFRSADDWLGYHRQFGRGGVLDAAIGGLERAAQNTALMRTFGTSPRAAFDADVERLKARADVVEAARVGGDFAVALFQQVDGTTRIPDSIGLAKVGQVTRAWISITKLGGVVLSALPDIAVRAASLRHAGINPLSAAAGGLTDLAARLPDDSARREVADLIGAGIDGTVGAIAQAFRAEDGLPGVMSRSLDLFFRLNLMNWWTTAQKTGVGLMLSHHLGARLGTGWQHLDDFTREGLSRYGISAEAWTLISGQARALRRAEDGRLYLTPEIVRGISDADMLAYVRPRSKNPQARALAVTRGRDELETSLATYFADQVRSAVTDPTARTRARLQGLSRPGTMWGEAVRFITQLKAYPTTYIQRHVARELYRGGTGGKIRPDVGGLATLIVGTTLLGYVSQSAKEMSRGRTPRDPANWTTWTAAFIQGGGAGIYGDFLFGQYSRFGGSLAGTLAGPWLGTADSLAGLLSAARDGQDLGANAIRFGVNAVPLVNLFYTRAALDYLILYRLQEASSPGYLRRLERRIAKENNQTFLFPPSRAIPRGGF